MHTSLYLQLSQRNSTTSATGVKTCKIRWWKPCVFEKKHQVKQSCIDRPPAFGEVPYSHTEAVRAPFSVAWTIAREKAPCTELGQTSNRENSQDSVRWCRNKYVSYGSFGQTTPSSGASKNSQSMFCNNVSMLRSGDFILPLEEATDLGNDAWTCVNSSECLVTTTYCVWRMICEVKISGERVCIASLHSLKNASCIRYGHYLEHSLRIRNSLQLVCLRIAVLFIVASVWFFNCEVIKNRKFWLV